MLPWYARKRRAYIRSVRLAIPRCCRLATLPPLRRRPGNFSRVPKLARRLRANSSEVAKQYTLERERLAFLPVLAELLDQRQL